MSSHDAERCPPDEACPMCGTRFECACDGSEAPAKPEPERCTVMRLVVEIMVPDEEFGPDEKDVREELDSILEDRLLPPWTHRIKSCEPWATGEKPE